MEINFARRFYMNAKCLAEKKRIPTKTIEEAVGINWRGFKTNAYRGVTPSYGKMRKIAEILDTSVDNMCGDDSAERAYIGLLCEKADILNLKIKKCNNLIAKLGCSLEDFDDKDDILERKPQKIEKTLCKAANKRVATPSGKKSA